MNFSSSTRAIEIVNDVYVTVPDSVQLMTPYVLQEQKDWFEDEIKFLRTFVKPGMKILDIGANYGLYTLTMAKLVGDQGKIWSFEPTSATVACLRQSILHNGYNNIELVHAGLSDHIGKAKFYTNPNAELNSLSKDPILYDMGEQIQLLTLDQCMKIFKWKDIDFIKLDAEGEENNILKKGKALLSATSPLIMFGLTHGDKVNISLINRFKSLGYKSYRLVPSLNIIIPFEHDKEFDGFLLNLFCCKNDTAAILESAEILVSSYEEIDPSFDEDIASEYFSRYGFSKYFPSNAFKKSGASDGYMGIVMAYILAHSDKTYPAAKIGYLMTALNRIREMLDSGERRIERLATFARIAFDAG